MEVKKIEVLAAELLGDTSEESVGRVLNTIRALAVIMSEPHHEALPDGTKTIGMNQHYSDFVSKVGNMHARRMSSFMKESLK